MRSVLITGGTGSFGKAFLKSIVKDENIERIVVFSRDELKQWELQSVFSVEEYPKLRYFLGDIRDYERIRRACYGIDLVVHAAALKQVPAAEYNPGEFIKTNVIGTQNLIEASVDAGVKQVVALSTDKASSPINLYGATKLCSDKLVIAANRYTGNRLKGSIVRYGNVMGSRGSVIPLFIKSREQGLVRITDPNMTRFNITLSQAVDVVKKTIRIANGGELVVPKMPSYRLQEVADAVAPTCEQIIVGKRPGEKLHEELYTEQDCSTLLETDDLYIIPSVTNQDSYIDRFKERSGEEIWKSRRMESYSSEKNDYFLTAHEIATLVKEQGLDASE